ncbi:MAG: ParB/RepB/Spo0J family partition protein [Clostridiales bacterium]|nr:ParB/RepB/Spo0J family partition protein [Clostridiales bacterium]
MSDNNSNKSIRNIPLKAIRPNPGQPRKYFDPEAMDTLTRSIERYGVLSPITVRECGDDEYVLISGERRYRAAYSAGLKTIPCIVTENSTDCAILSLLENLQREDLSFLEIAQSYKELIKGKGLSSHELSRKIGGKPFEIKERMRLMMLDPIVRKYIRNFNLSEREARALLRIHDRDTQIEAVRYICEHSLSENEAVSFISELLKTGHQPNIQINKFKDIKILKNTLANAVGLIRQSGIDAEFNEKTYDWGEEFIIVIRN